LQLADNAIRHSLRRQVDHRAPVLGLAHAVRRLHREIGFSNAPDLFAEIARVEWRAAGIQKMYGYQVDVATEPRWYRIQTTFSEDPKLSADISREIVLGFQGRTLGPTSVAMTMKHFPGDGAVDKGLDPHNTWGQWAVYPTPDSFFKYQLPPFQAAVDAGTSSIMSYYNNPSNAKSGRQFPAEWWQPEKQQFEEVAGAYNATLLGKLLRERMGFKGYINTDSGVLGNNAFGVEKLTLPERFAKAVKAGVSLFSDNNDPKGLIDAVNQHLLNEEDLNASVTYLLEEMFHRLGKQIVLAHAKDVKAAAMSG